MAQIVTMGEMIVEIMRTETDAPLDKPALFRGPFPSGAPAIFIDTAARLGAKTAIVGGVGNDDFGKCLTERLEKDGVDCSYVVKSSAASTGCAFVMYYSNGDRKFIFHIGNTPAVSPEVPDDGIFDGIRYYHIMGCSLSASIPFGKKIIQTMKNASAKGAKISFDPNIRPELMGDPEALELILEAKKYANVLLPGKSELMLITGCDDIPSAVKKAFENPVLELLIVKNGSKGCIVYTREEEYAIGVYPVEVQDATGAGDSFDAALLASLVADKPLEEAVKIATAAASLNTAAFGPMEGKISPETVRELMSKTRLEKEEVCPCFQAMK